MSEEIVWMSAAELLDAYRARTLSPVEALNACIARIEEVNPKLNAFVTLTLEAAGSAAKEAEQAYLRGRSPPPRGIPLGVKDNIFTKGIRTTYGSTLYEDFVPDQGRRRDREGQGSRRVHPGQDQHARVRHDRHHREPPLR